MNVFAVIPAYNEKKYVGRVVTETKKHCNQVIVVDDGSTDETAKLAEEAGAKVLRLSKNKGKGFALRAGAKRAVKAGADVIVFIDADQQHRPEDIPKLLNAIKDADMVFASRVAGYMPPLKKFGNWFLGKLFFVFFHSRAGDLLCGFKAFRSEVLKDIMWTSDGYSVETEIAARVGVCELRVAYIKIPSIYIETSKGTGVIDGVIMAWNMLKIKAQLVSEKR